MTDASLVLVGRCVGPLRLPRVHPLLLGFANCVPHPHYRPGTGQSVPRVRGEERQERIGQGRTCYAAVR